MSKNKAPDVDANKQTLPILWAGNWDDLTVSMLLIHKKYLLGQFGALENLKNLNLT